MFDAETTFEMKFDGKFNYENSGAEDFRTDNNTNKITFAARTEDVVITIKSHRKELPTIKSVMISDGALSDDAEKQEYCASECGYQDEAMPIIINGVEARVGAWPWNAGN